MAEMIKLERKEAVAVLREKSNNKESLARKQEGNKLVSKLAEVTEIMAETSKELSNAQPKAKWYQPIVDFMQKFSKQNTPTTPSASTPQQPAKIAAKTANPKKDQINKESHYYMSKPDIERRNSYKGHSR